MINQYVPVAVIGLSHKTAPVEIREKAAFSADEQKRLLRDLPQQFELEGYLILSTCNRTELYLSGDEINIHLSKIRAWLDNFKKCDYFNNDQLTYLYKGKSAVQHFFKVISGLDSQVLGEPQITGQVKEGYEQAHMVGTTDTFLNKIYNFGLQAEKKIRSDTFLSDGAVSVSYAGVELARKIYTNLNNKKALLIGAGETAELAATHFIEKGLQSIKIVNRTFEKAQQLAEQFHGSAYHLEELEQVLQDVDIVISATASDQYVLTAKQFSAITRRRHYKPLFIIDLAIPRDIDPKANNVEGIYLYNLDDLEEVVQKNLESRRQEIPKAMKIIENYVREFNDWMATHSISSTIRLLRKYFDDVRLNEIERLKSRLPEEKLPEVDYLTRSIINKLLHQHIKTLKNGNSDEKLQQKKIELIHELYELSKD